MLPDEPLRQTPTHTAEEVEGRVLGLDLSRVKWVLLALVVGLVPGFLCIGPWGLSWATLIMFGPALLGAAVQYFLLQDKPPRWFFQWLETRLTGAHVSPLRRSSL